MGLLYIYGIHWFKCATGIGLETNNKEKILSNANKKRQIVLSGYFATKTSVAFADFES